MRWGLLIGVVINAGEPLGISNIHMHPALNVSLKHCWTHLRKCSSVALSGNGEYIAMGCGSIELFDLRTLSKITSFVIDQPSPPYIFTLSFSPDSRYLAVGTRSSDITILNIEAKVMAKSLKGHTGEVGSVAFSPSGDCLLSGSRDQTVKLWNAQDESIVLNLNARTESYSKGFEVTSVAFSADGKFIAAGGVHGSVCLWNAADGILVAQHVAHSYAVVSLVFSPIGYKLVFETTDRAAILWDLNSHIAVSDSGQSQGREATSSTRILIEDTAWLMSTAWSPDGRWLLIGNHNGILHILDEDGQTRFTLFAHADHGISGTDPTVNTGADFHRD